MRREVALNNQKFIAMIDCGSEISLISTQTFRSLDPRPKYRKWPHESVISVDESNVTPKFITEPLNFKIGSKSYKFEFGIKDNTCAPILIGIDILQKIDAVLHIKKRLVYIEDDCVSKDPIKSSPQKNRLSNASIKIISDDFECETPTTSLISASTTKYHSFRPNESKLIDIKFSENNAQKFIIKTSKFAKENNWNVEKGIISPSSPQQKIWVTNLNISPNNLPQKYNLCELIPCDRETVDLNLKFPDEKQSRTLTTSANTFTSMDTKIWERINSEESPLITFLNEDERKLDDFDKYFIEAVSNTDFTQWKVNEDIPPKYKYIFSKVFKKFRQVFAFPGDPLGKVDVWTHRVNTGDCAPFKCMPYRVSESQKLQIEECINEMMAKGVIVPCVSQWASPVTLVPKRDGTVRFCIDYRRLNNATQDDAYPIPRLDEPLSLMRGSDTFSVMDCDSCYWQIPLDSNSQKKTSFVCHLGTFMFKVMPFGLKTAPASCMRVMGKLFNDENRRISFIYMDDIICFSKGIEEHIRRIVILLKAMQKHGLKLKQKKCIFAEKSVKYLGHIIDANGYYPDPERVEGFLRCTPPKNVKDIQSFLGFCSFYRQFIKDFSNLSEPLVRLLSKKAKFVWNSEQQNSFEAIRDGLKNCTLLTHFDPQKNTIIRADASDYAIGGHVLQISDGIPQLIGATSRMMNKHEINYSTTEKECLAILHTIEKYRPFLYGRKFSVITDHCSLCYLMKAKNLSGRLSRWALKLMEYDFDIKYNKGKNHSDADYLSRYTSHDCPNTDTEIPCATEIHTDSKINVIHNNNVFSKCSALRFEIDAEFANFNNWESVNISEEQENDPIFGPIFHKLSPNSLISTSERNRIIKFYTLSNNILYRNSNNSENLRQICVPISLIRTVLDVNHGSALSGHFGQRKTMWRIILHFYWKGMALDVINFVKSCHECQVRKPRNSKNHSFQTAIPIALKPFENMSFDLVGPLPISHSEKYILTVTDQLTKFRYCRPSGKQIGRCCNACPRKRSFL